MKTRTVLLLIILSVFPIKASPVPVELDCSPKEVSAFQGEKIMLNIMIKNNQPISIRTGTGYFLSYHVYDRHGTMIRFDNRRFRIPVVIQKNATTRFQCPVFFEQQKEGAYVLEFDLVKEGKFWGAEKKWKTSKIKLHLKKLLSPVFKNKYLKTFYQTGNPWIDQEQYLLRLTLKNCETITNGKIIGFFPGSSYPQIWIRDIATLIAFAKMHYPLKILEVCVEKFMENQSPNGEIPDWVNIRSETDKNSVTTDQESSLVLAAFEIAIEKPLWLRKKIRGKTITARLESALEWVWQNRRDSRYRLIWSGYTADWGDVEKSYPDQRAIKLSNRSQKTFSTYTQSKYIQAMDRLIKIFTYLKEEGKARKWMDRSKITARYTKKYLYSKKQGYFIIHIAPGTGQFHQLEEQILAVGGNAEAILAGLMDQNQIKRFLEVLEDKRRTYHLPNVSFTLLPPFPQKFFPHPLLSHPWYYQNGGQWDWIGGKLVRALYQSNFRESATRYLIEIIQKNLKNLTIFEWEDRQGNPGPGSAISYAGAAGEIGNAILKGYLGYRQNFYSHRINPPAKQFFLKIDKRDSFSIRNNQTMIINIERLRNRILCIEDQSKKIPSCFNQKGTFRIKPENQLR